MPFGNYKDFDDCVKHNGDKSNPQAYCAVIHKKITGNWPNQKEATSSALLKAKLSVLSEFVVGRHDFDRLKDELQTLVNSTPSSLPWDSRQRLREALSDINELADEKIDIPLNLEKDLPFYYSALDLLRKGGKRDMLSMIHFLVMDMQMSNEDAKAIVASYLLNRHVECIHRLFLNNQTDR